MSGGATESFYGCLKAVLKPAVKFCLRRSFKLQDLLEACKIALVEAAAEELMAQGQTPNVSRISIMTGVHRPDVQRLLREEPQAQPRNIIARITGQWQSDRRFTTAAGKPRCLSAESRESEFARLVQTVSGDLNPYTVLFELERLGLVERGPRGLTLKQHEYVATRDTAAAFSMLSRDSGDLLSAVEENLLDRRDPPNLHLTTEYDNISPKRLPLIRRWLIKEGTAFHARARRFLARYDRDINPRLKEEGPGTRVSLCAFSRTDSPPALPRSAASQALKSKG